MPVPEAVTVFDVGSLRNYLSQLPDPRARRGVRYALVDLLSLLILAKLGGEDGMKGMAEWVRLRGKDLVRMLGLPRQTLPHQTTYERVLEALEHSVGAFFAQQAPANFTITLDGKTLRGTIPVGTTQGVHLLAAYVPEQGVVLMQIEVECKANEITVAPCVLDMLDLRGHVVTGDAMFTQRPLCEQIVRAGGDYVLPVKANQAALQQAITEVFMPAPVTPGHSRCLLPEATAYTINSGHGRIEQRFLTVSSQLNQYADWPHLHQVFRLQRLVHYQRTGRLTYEVVFGVTSLSTVQCDADRLLRITRDHWLIENRLHYVREVTFGEDGCPIRHPKRQRVLACLNNLAIGLIPQCDFDYISQARRFFALNYHAAIQLIS